MKPAVKFTLLTLGLFVVPCASLSASLPAALPGDNKGADICFSDDLHDFGRIPEDGKVYCRFPFVNCGDMALEIRRVNTSCGCTTPTFTKLPIMPGDTGVIEVAYNTDGRPGNFRKTITVYTNSVLHPSYALSIMGTVEAHQATPESMYPKSIGNLRLKQNSLDYGQVIIGDILTRSIPVFNNNETTALKLSLKDVPSHLSVTLGNTLLAPRESSVITVVYRTMDVKDYGRREDQFYLQADGDQHVSGLIRVTAVLNENLSAWKNAAEKPVCRLVTPVIDLGEIHRGESAQGMLEILNEGGAKLSVRKVSCPASCLEIKNKVAEVAPGRSVKMKVNLDTEGLHGVLFYHVEVITNDPANPVQTFSVKASILE